MPYIPKVRTHVNVSDGKINPQLIAGYLLIVRVHRHAIAATINGKSPETLLIGDVRLQLTDEMSAAELIIAQELDEQTQL